MHSLEVIAIPSTDQVTQLEIVASPNLRQVTGLPIELETLVLTDCPAVTRLELPAGLKSLRLRLVGRLAELKLPPGLETLSLEDCPGLLDRAELPESLQQLSVVSDNRIARLVSQPPNLAELFVAGCERLTTLMTTAREVQVFRTSLASIEGAAPYHLTLERCHLAHRPTITGASTLHLERCTGLGTLDWLPGALQELRLTACNGLERVEGLPSSVKVVEVTMCSNLVRIDDSSCSPLGPCASPGADPLELVVCETPTLVRCAVERLSLLTVKHAYDPATRQLDCLLSDHDCRVKLDDSSIDGVDWLPPTVKELELSACSEIKSLDQLPDQLQGLTLYAVETEEPVTRLPSALRRLEVTSSTLTLRPGCLPTEIEEITMTDVAMVGTLQLGRHPWLTKLAVNGKAVSREQRVETLEQYQALWRPWKGANTVADEEA